MWTVTFSVLIALSLLVSLVAIFLAARSVVAAQELRQVLQTSKPWDSKSFETRLLEAEDALKMLANRVKMQKVRNAITHTDRDKGGEPDVHKEPEEWRKWMNAQLRITPRGNS